MSKARDNSQGIATLASINSGPLGGDRNFIINGGCRISQRGSVAAVQGAYTYGGADRICSSVNGTLTGGSIQQIVGGPASGVEGFTHAMGGLTVSTAGQVLHQTRLEAKDTIYLNGRTITISCKVYQDTGVTQTGNTLSIQKPTNTADTFSALTTLQTSPTFNLPSGVLTPVSWTLNLGASDASLGLAPTVYMPFAAAITNKYFCVTDWCVEIGSVASPFPHRKYADEVRLCQRYCEKSYDISIAPGTVSGAGREEEFRNQTTGITQYGLVRYKVPKRATTGTVITLYSDSTGAIGQTSQDNGANTAISASSIGENGFRTSWTNGAGRFGASYHWLAINEL